MNEETDTSREAIPAPLTAGKIVMAPEQFEARMKKIFQRAPNGHCLYDEEEAHGEADGLMLELLRALGYEKGCEVFENSPKWYA